MPYDVTTPFGTRHGVLSQEEEMGNRFDLQRQQLLAQAQIAALNNQAQQNIQGTFGQRSAADLQRQELLGQQRMGEIGAQGDQNVRAITAGQAPEMGRLGMEQELFRENGPLRAAEAQGRIGKLNFQNDINGYVQNMLRGRLGGPGGAPGATGMPALSADDLDQMAALSAMANGGTLPDLATRQLQRQMLTMQGQDMMQNHARAQAQEALTAGDIPRVQKIAAEGGIPMPHRAVAELETDPVIQQKMNDLMTRLGAVNNSTFYITDDEIQQLQQALSEVKIQGARLGFKPEDVNAWAMSKLNAATTFTPSLRDSFLSDRSQNFSRRAVGLPPIQ